MAKQNKRTEKLFYTVFIVILVILAIVVPIIIIQTGSSSTQFIYLSDDNSSENSVQVYPDKYFTPSELSKYLKEYAKRRSLVFESREIGKTSPLKNPIREVILRKEGNDKQRVIVVSGLLANDWSSILVSIAIMNRFYADYKRTYRILDDYSFHFIPLLNPDGYNYSMSLPIRSNWILNYNEKHKSDSKNVLYGFGEGEAPQEAKLFKKYFLGNKDKIKAVFVLFTPKNHSLQDYYYYIHEGYKSANKKFVENLVAAIKEENKWKFQYKEKLDETEKGGIDDWVIEITKPKTILVVDFCANYKATAPDALPGKMKELGDGIHFVISRLVGTFKAAVNTTHTYKDISAFPGNRT